MKTVGRAKVVHNGPSCNWRPIWRLRSSQCHQSTKCTHEEASCKYLSHNAL